MARPKKTISDLPKNWKDKVIKLKKQGASDVEVRAELDISQDLWERFIEEIKEFSLTIKRGDDLCKAWWEKHGRTNLNNKEFNCVLWYMNMKNRFGWKDNNNLEVSGKDGKPIIVIASRDYGKRLKNNTDTGIQE